MADDRLALEISYLRIAADGIRISPEAMDMDGVSARFGRAADALEAVLKLADELTGDAAPSSALEEDRAWVRAACAAKFRETIARELTGEASRA